MLHSLVFVLLFFCFFPQETSQDKKITSLPGAHSSIGHLQVCLVKLEKVLKYGAQARTLGESVEIGGALQTHSLIE